MDHLVKAAQDTSAQVPLWLTLLSIFGATLVGGAITIVTSVLIQRAQISAAKEEAEAQAERDHDRWEKEQRFEAYANLQQIIYEASTLPVGSAFPPEMVERRGAAVARVDILGPHGVITAAGVYLKASRTGVKNDELEAALDAYLVESRKALGINMGVADLKVNDTTA